MRRHVDRLTPAMLYYGMSRSCLVLTCRNKMPYPRYVASYSHLRPRFRFPANLALRWLKHTDQLRFVFLDATGSASRISRLSVGT